MTAALDSVAVNAEPHHSAVLTCTRHGWGWRLERGDQSVLVEHRVGMLHLAVLIANPGQEIPAIDLAAGVAAARAVVHGGAAARNSGSAQPVLDQAAVQAYQYRLSQLRAEIGNLEFSNDDEGIVRAQAERDWLMAELVSASAIGGRTRRFPDNSERARIAVGRAIRRALTLIEDASPSIGQYLHSTVHTGMYCSYWPIWSY